MSIEKQTLNVEAPRENDSFHDYISRHAPGDFAAHELIVMVRSHIITGVPPSKMWPNIIPTIAVAQELRNRMGHPLIVGNGYRPKALNKRVGGARRSKHITFQALDLDLPMDRRSRANQELFYASAVEIFLDFGIKLKMGLGLYRHWRGTRVHIDTGCRRRYWSRKYVKPLIESMR